MRTAPDNARGEQKVLLYMALLGANFIYACESIFVKLASAESFASCRYCLFMACAVAVLALYAVIWQQIIARMPVAEAYMFKGTALIFVLFLSVLLFGEHITMWNVIGASMIIAGIVLFSKL